MKTTLLFLLLVCVLQTSAHSRASVVVSPNRSQHVEYELVSLSCEQFGSGDWTVWRYTTNNLVLSQCGSGWGSQTSSSCEIKSPKKHDTGVYWCESKHRYSSHTINITVTGSPSQSAPSVVLQSPVLPVMEGHDVTLTCEIRQVGKKTTMAAPLNLTASFYKDDSLIRTEPTGHMTIHNFSKSDEGSYKCGRGSDESPSSWISLIDYSEPASLTVLPDSSQQFEYCSLTLNCGDNSSAHGWKVIRATTSGDRMDLQTCGDKGGTTTNSGCHLGTIKKQDSAIYWCESPARKRSNSVNITVYDLSTPVILQSPVLPVMKGDNVTLTCKTSSTHCKTESSNLTATFYKDGDPIRTVHTGHMIIFHVTKADEGIYSCDISSGEKSPSSWLFVRDPDDVTSSTITGKTLSVFRLLLHLVVFCPYFISTVLMVSLYRRRPTGGKLPEDDVELDEPYDDVIADVTTEHHF